MKMNKGHKYYSKRVGFGKTELRSYKGYQQPELIVRIQPLESEVIKFREQWIKFLDESRKLIPTYLPDENLFDDIISAHAAENAAK